MTPGGLTAAKACSFFRDCLSSAVIRCKPEAQVFELVGDGGCEALCPARGPSEDMTAISPLLSLWRVTSFVTRFNQTSS